jgi:UDP-3-O-[3-hydroxymyristoyl] glucosamine N-acyltransferase
VKLNPPQSILEINDIINVEIVGDHHHMISGINEIHKVETGDLVFVDHPKYYQKALDSAATTILINTKDVEVPTGKALLFSENPFADYNKLTKHYSPFIPWKINESPQSLGTNSYIHPGVILGRNVSIGKDCIIHAGVVVYDNTIIGDGVIIHPNAVLGSDAFYFNKKGETYTKMHSCGRLVLEDLVEIGSACTIDRGVSGDTLIGAGTKLDSQVHVGHDTVIGKNCLIAAQVGIAGCVIIENDVTLWGQVGVRSDILIGKGAIVMGQSGVTKSIEGGKTYFGTPIKEAREAYKELAILRSLKK